MCVCVCVLSVLKVVIKMCVCRRKVQMSMMWKEGQRRRSPRISGLNNACNGQRVKDKVGGTTTNADHRHHRINGPASRTRARKKRKLRPLQDVAAPSSPFSQQSQDADVNDMEEYGDKRGHEEKSNTDKPFPQSNDNDPVTNPDQPSSVPSASSMPEKRVLEHIVDILQRRDTYEIFAEPVDPKEVEDYYEIIKEPMDFGTMRAKLHEGMYTSLEQFEHDVFLISENAMHFNSSTTIYFRQARAIHELAKKVFHALKNDPDNFKLEFSETRRRTTRRQHSEANGPVHSSGQKLAPNLRCNSTAVNVSSKTMPNSLSGSSNIKRSRGNPGSSIAATHVSAREHEMLSGAKDGRKTNYAEVDRRCTYVPWMSFLNENNSMSSTTHNNSKTLMQVNQQDIGYKESLMTFVRDLGPTAHMIAKRKLQGWSSEASNFWTTDLNSRLQAPNCQNLLAFASGQQRPTTLDTHFSISISHNVLDQFHGLQTIAGETTAGTNVVSTEASPNSAEKRMTSIASRWEDYSRNDKNALCVLGSDQVHKKGNNRMQSIMAAREPNFPVAGFKDAGSKSPSLKSEKSKSLEPTLEYSQPDVTQCNWRNNLGSSPAWPLQSSSMSTSHHQAIAAAQGSGGSSRPSQPMPIASHFTFDLPYLKTRLDQINSSRRDRQVQCTGSRTSSDMVLQL